jgi:anti-anti-sigma factor
MMMNSAEQEMFVTRNEGDTNIINVNVDSLDHRYIEVFKTAINSSLQANSPRLLLNLESVNFMDSAGLGIVLYGFRATQQRGGEFAVSDVSGYVEKLFKLTGVAKAVKVYAHEADAL